MPLVIDSLGHGHTHTRTQARIPTIRTGSILRKGPARAWFKNTQNRIESILIPGSMYLESYRIYFTSITHPYIKPIFPKVWYRAYYNRKPSKNFIFYICIYDNDFLRFSEYL